MTRQCHHEPAQRVLLRARTVDRALAVFDHGGGTLHPAKISMSLLICAFNQVSDTQRMSMLLSRSIIRISSSFDGIDRMLICPSLSFALDVSRPADVGAPRRRRDRPARPRVRRRLSQQRGRAPPDGRLLFAGRCPAWTDMRRSEAAAGSTSGGPVRCTRARSYSGCRPSSGRSSSRGPARRSPQATASSPPPPEAGFVFVFV